VTRFPTGRLRRLVGGGLAVVGLGAALSACGTSGTGLAQQACGHVNRSIALLAEAGRQTDATLAVSLRQSAYVQLRDALPIAAEAAYADGQYQALMTTVAESSRVPESTLVPALQAQCQAADTSPFGQSPAPSSIPPPAPVTSSP
jgi:uncharacterized protein YfiM (DUF2279 family)